MYLCVRDGKRTNFIRPTEQHFLFDRLAKHVGCSNCSDSENYSGNKIRRVWPANRSTHFRFDRSAGHFGRTGSDCHLWFLSVYKLNTKPKTFSNEIELIKWEKQNESNWLWLLFQNEAIVSWHKRPKYNNCIPSLLQSRTTSWNNNRNENNHLLIFCFNRSNALAWEFYRFCTNAFMSNKDGWRLLLQWN